MKKKTDIARLKIKVDTSQAVKAISKLRIEPIDLGSLQAELKLAQRDHKAKTTAFYKAQDAFDASKIRLANARDKLASASRAVMAEV